MNSTTIRVALGCALLGMVALTGCQSAGADQARDNERPTPSASPSGPATTGPTTTPTAPPSPTHTPKPVVVIVKPGDTGAKVREVQARLVQIDWLVLPFDGVYDDATVKAVKGFQAKRGFPVTGTADRRTYRRLVQMTRVPSTEELKGRIPPIPSSNTNTPGPLDPRCRTGEVLCIDKASRTLRWVVDGQVKLTLDTRFGASSTPTREGVFSIYLKSRNHVSSLYDSSMPFAMFFDGGQAVHYSSDFAARSYSGASHGCVNIRDYNAISALFDQVQIGTKVVVYWS